MKRSRWWIGLLGWMIPVMAGAATVPCREIGWDYPGHHDLARFHVYVSTIKGRYPINREAPHKSQPTASIPAIPEMMTRVSCEKLRLSGEGPWYVVVTAVNKHVTFESTISNELTLGASAPGHPEVPPAPKPPVYVPPWGDTPYKPPPVMDGPSPLPPITAPTPTWAPWQQRLSESCLWQGRPCR